MDAKEKSEDELLGLTSTSSDVNVSSNVNDSVDRAMEIEEEMLLLSSPGTEGTTKSGKNGGKEDVNDEELDDIENLDDDDDDKALADVENLDDNDDDDDKVLDDVENLDEEEDLNDTKNNDDDNLDDVENLDNTGDDDVENLDEEDADDVENLEDEPEEIIDESESDLAGSEEERAAVSYHPSEEDDNEVISDDSGEDVENVATVEDEDSVLEIEDSLFEEVNDSVLEGKINIFYCNGALFVWNADDVQMLREECRIVGKLTGCLPRAPRQNSHLGLPLELMPEEAKLLVDVDAAVIVEEDFLSDTVLKAREKAFKSVREENFKIQQRLYKESRKEEVRQRMDEIIAGKKAKKRKLQEEKKDKKEKDGEKDEEREKQESQNTSEELRKKNEEKDGMDEGSKKKKKKTEEKEDAEDDDDEEEDGEKSAKNEEDGEKEEDPEDQLTVDDIVTSETSTKHSLVQIFTENPWKKGIRVCTKWKFPETEKEAIRYTVFKDLWKKGYYLTSGSKFGGDFLVYPGDPCRFHSHFIALCLDQAFEMSILDLVSMGRLASNVRKVTLLCSLSPRRRVSYTSLQWTGIS